MNSDDEMDSLSDNEKLSLHSSLCHPEYDELSQTMNSSTSSLPDGHLSPTSIHIQYKKSPILPPVEDQLLTYEIEIQRQKWIEFLKKKKYNLSETWLWQYWKKESRPSKVVKVLSKFSSKIKQQRKLKKLIRHGIPPELRGTIWQTCLGANEKMQEVDLASHVEGTSPVNIDGNDEDTTGGDSFPQLDGILDGFHSDRKYRNVSYEYLLELISTLDGTQVGDDIEKDLHRTLSHIDWCQSQDGLDTLRRILRAYALRNPSIGYCQSMNYLGALLLLHMEEKKAFWCLACLLEDILPHDYYDVSMIGARVDQQVFHSLIAMKMPNIYAMLKATNTSLDPVLVQWFLCTYINSLPLYAVCRVWDCLFYEGDVALFRIGLGLIAMKQSKLLQCTDLISVYMVMKSGYNTHVHSYELEEPPVVENNNKVTALLSSLGSFGSGSKDNERRGSIELQTTLSSNNSFNSNNQPSPSWRSSTRFLTSSPGSTGNEMSSINYLFNIVFNNGTSHSIGSLSRQYIVKLRARYRMIFKEKALEKAKAKEQFKLQQQQQQQSKSLAGREISETTTSNDSNTDDLDNLDDCCEGDDIEFGLVYSDSLSLTTEESQALNASLPNTAHILRRLSKRRSASAASRSSVHTDGASITPNRRESIESDVQRARQRRSQLFLRALDENRIDSLAVIAKEMFEGLNHQDVAQNIRDDGDDDDHDHDSDNDN